MLTCLYGVTLTGLFILLFFKFKGQLGSVINLLMLFWFTTKLHSKKHNQDESFADVV